MRFDWMDLAEALRGVLVIESALWIIYAWLRRVDYRAAVLGLFALGALDWLAHAFATWAENTDLDVPTDFSAFSLFVLLGAILGLLAAAWQARRARIPLPLLLDAALVTVLAGGIGARAYHVLSHWDYYAQNTGDIINLSQGGMGLRGGLALGVVALLLFAGLRHAPFWKLADAGALGICLALAIGWNGARLVGANYGVIADVSFAQDLPDVYGLVAPRIPIQSFAILFFLLLFLALTLTSWRWHPSPGLIALVFLVLFGLGSLALDFGRGDETLLWNGWRVDQLVDLVFAGVGLLVLGIQNISSHTTERNETVEAKS